MSRTRLPGEPNGARALSLPEMVVYRALPTLGAIAIALFRWLHRWTDPAGVDPGSLRALAVLACGAVVAASFVADRRRLRITQYVATAVVTGWVLSLLALNGFADQYALTLLLVMTVAAVAFEEDRHLLLYYGCSLGALLLLSATTPQPRIRLVIYLPVAAMFCLLCYLALLLKRRGELKLVRSEERYALAASGATDGLWDWDLSANAIRFSTRWKATLGYGDAEVGTSPAEWLERVHPDDRERVRLAISRCEPGCEFSVEYRIRHRDGAWRWMQARGARQAGSGERLAGSQADVTERKAAEAQLARQAMFDSLTGLANRALCLDRLDRMCRRRDSASDRAPFAVLFIDVDRFRVLNDSLGHPAGDEVLAEIARRLEPLAGASDTLAHLGGDDFALVLDAADGEAALAAARRVRAAVAQPYRLKEHDVTLGATVGIALSPGTAGAEELLRDAELAMHRAKDVRGERIRIFDGAMHTQAVQRLRLETELRQALHRRELCVHFQPITELRSGRITGFEALARWHHPQRGLLLPAEFLPLAEETGLIVPLGHAVLTEAAVAIATWKAAGAALPLCVHVNLSPSQLLEQRLTSEVAHVLHSFSLAPGELGIEVTEGAVLGEPELALRQLARLRALGLRISIDDFGTGYSSLSHVHRLPVDTLKIDRSFVADLGRAEAADAGRGSELVGIIVLLARRLGLDVVAEGVETSVQLDAVRRLGCDRAQGHLFGPALPASECLTLLTRPVPAGDAARRGGGRETKGVGAVMTSINPAPARNRGMP